MDMLKFVPLFGGTPVVSPAASWSYIIRVSLERITVMPRHMSYSRRPGALSRMPHVKGRWLVTVLVVCASVACGTGLPSPQSEMATGQAMLDLNQQIVDLSETNAMMQAQVDSLRDVVARQDTVLRLIAAQVGVSVPPPQ
jgi:hypothetical protein